MYWTIGILTKMPSEAFLLLFTLVHSVLCGKIRIDTAIIYGAEYKDTLPSFYRAIDASDMDITVTEFSKEAMTNIVGTCKPTESYIAKILNLPLIWIHLHTRVCIIYICRRLQHIWI